MKGSDSGMPGQEYWESFYDAACMIERLLGEDGCRGDATEVGCGYGTFTLPAARETTGTVHASDIEPDLGRALVQEADLEAIPNIASEARGLIVDGTGLGPGSQSHAMIYNLLHIEEPDILLREACAFCTRTGGSRSSIGAATSQRREVQPWRYGPPQSYVRDGSSVRAFGR